jgi:hypothetical protein
MVRKIVDVERSDTESNEQQSYSDGNDKLAVRKHSFSVLFASCRFVGSQ